MRAEEDRAVARRARRAWWGGVAGGVVGALVVLAGATGGVGATPAAARTDAPSRDVIKHIVVLYQENHSFDETLGDFCQLHGNRCDGYVGGVRLKGGAVVAMRRSPDVVPNVWHDVQAQRTAIDGGSMDGWARVRGCHPSRSSYPCLTYYAPADIPNLAALASHFVVSDHTFSMADSPSWGGHLYAAAATLDHFTGDLPRAVPDVARGPGWGCNSNRVANWVDPATHKLSAEPSCIPARPGELNPHTFKFNGAFRSTRVSWVPTIFDRLHAKGLSWKIYRTSWAWSICPSFADCYYRSQRNNVVSTRKFKADIHAGRLPSFSVVLPNGPQGATSQHNQTSMRVGDNWIGEVLNALEHGSQWSSTAVFITYDDCGCFYDHVPPGRNPDGTQQGIRVPMVIVSPYARRGYTDSHPATFASILRFTEETFGLQGLSPNDRRAYDYAHAFNFSAPPSQARVDLQQHTVSPAIKAYLATHRTEADDPT